MYQRYVNTRHAPDNSRGGRLSVPLWRIQYPYTIFLMKTPESLVIHLFSPLSPQQKQADPIVIMHTRPNRKIRLVFLPLKDDLSKEPTKEFFFAKHEGGNAKILVLLAYNNFSCLCIPYQ